MEMEYRSERKDRLSMILRKDMKLSSGLINRIKWQGTITVNEIPVHTNHQVNPGDVIRCCLDEEVKNYQPEDGKLSILYEDDAILVIDKPSGILIHPSTAKNSGTIANYVQGYYQRTGQKCAFHPVTRLDRDTFGVVLVAKNGHYHAILNNAHAEGRIEKTYEALVFGDMPEKEGRIDAAIGRKPLPSLLREVNPEGKTAVTEYEVIERFGEYSRVMLHPITGRTHQLRVHCAYLGAPILGDPQYGTAMSTILSDELGFHTQRLCARMLAFPHPITGERIEVLSKIEIKTQTE